MRCWRCGLPSVDISEPPSRSTSSDRAECIRLRGLLPHERLRPVDHLGRDLFAAVRGQAVHEHRVASPAAFISVAVDGPAGERPAAVARCSVSCPIDVHTSVYTASASRTAS